MCALNIRIVNQNIAGNVNIKKIFSSLLCFGLLVCTVFIYAIQGRLASFKHNNVIIDNISSDTHDFQKIGTTPHKLYVYSAYFQKPQRTFEVQTSVVIVGGLPANYSRQLICKFYDQYGRSFSKLVNADLQSISEEDNKFYKFRYEPMYITCNIGDDKLNSKDKFPTYVSILESQNSNKKITNLLKINYKENVDKIRFALCTQPFYNNFEEPLKLAEWIEFHRLMGIEKITLYNTTIGPKTSCLIHSYGDFIETLPWSCPYKFHVEIVQGAQLLMANECLLRYKGVADYLVIVDRDEMIIPSKTGGENYSDMFKNIGRQMTKENIVHEVSEYNFRNGFFIGTWNKKTNTSGIEISQIPLANEIVKNLQIVTQIKRRKILEPHNDRSKIIVVPDSVLEVSIHRVAKSVGNATVFNVSEEIAYSHHYRKTCPGNWCPVNGIERETSTKRFAIGIAEKIAHHLQSKAKHCKIMENLQIMNQKKKSGKQIDKISNN